MTTPLCKYKNMFGEPGTGIHKYKVAGISIVDVLVVIVGGIIISYFSGWSIYPVLVVLFVSGIVIHRLFCVRSGIDKLLFPEE
jgi:hypothetical protein